MDHCDRHSLPLRGGECPVCRAVEEKDREIIILKERIHTLEDALGIYPHSS
jgi:hypothetical protein